jgi:hypothetical protein
MSPTLTVEKSPPNSTTNPRTGLRTYTWQGRKLPSVTSVRQIAGLPHGLHQWTLNQLIAYVVDHAGDIATKIAANDPAQLQLVRAELRSASTAQRNAAADLGKAVHSAVETGQSLAAVPPEVAPRLRQYLDWLRVSEAEILASEFQCWNPTLGYAGTADLLVRLASGGTWLVDLKTGKGVYPEHALQLIAYSMAEFVGRDDVVDERLTALLHEVTGMAVLHLTDKGWEFLPVRADGETWAAFRGLLAFAGWMTDHGDMASVTTGGRRGREEAAA